MSKRTVCLAKDGHDYVFAYVPGHEAQAVEEIMAMAADTETDFDWMDAASLGFQIARRAAVDCRMETLSPARAARGEPKPSGAGQGLDGDDAKDGPCTNRNFP